MLWVLFIGWFEETLRLLLAAQSRGGFGEELGCHAKTAVCMYLAHASAGGNLFLNSLKGAESFLTSAAAGWWAEPCKTAWMLGERSARQQKGKGRGSWVRAGKKGEGWSSGSCSCSCSNPRLLGGDGEMPAAFQQQQLGVLGDKNAISYHGLL